MDFFQKPLNTIGANNKKDQFVPVILRSAFAFLSVLYGCATRIRNICYQRGWWETHRLPVPVVSVGNLVTGGTGKTPLTLGIARASLRQGYRAVILSRGYKGLAEQKGGVVSDGKRLLLSPRMAGDEPYMMAAALPEVPVIVGKNRVQSGKLAISRFHPDLILLDDGFQHVRLARDLNILLLDNQRPLGNGHLIPRGELRESSSAIQRADVIVMTRTTGRRKITSAMDSYLGDRPLFFAVHEPLLQALLPAHKKINQPLPGLQKQSPKLTGLPVFAFSAIARNHDFLDSVRQLGGEVVGEKGFPDHYRYSREDFLTISDLAQKTSAMALVTTAKDAVRIETGSHFPLDLFVIDVAIQFTRTDFYDFLFDALSKLIRS